MPIWAHAIYLIAFFSAAIVALNYRRMAINANNVTTQTLSNLENAQPTARAYLNAAKLIAIGRDGRMNVFTFARHDQMFIIKTLGSWDDLPDVWRELAGLNDQG